MSNSTRILSNEKTLLIYRGNYDQHLNVTFNITQNGIATIVPNNIIFNSNLNITNFTSTIIGLSPGRIEIVALATPSIVVEYGQNQTQAIQNKTRISKFTIPKNYFLFTTAPEMHLFELLLQIHTN